MSSRAAELAAAGSARLASIPASQSARSAITEPQGTARPACMVCLTAIAIWLAAVRKAGGVRSASSATATASRVPSTRPSCTGLPPRAVERMQFRVVEGETVGPRRGFRVASGSRTPASRPAGATPGRFSPGRIAEPAAPPRRRCRAPSFDRPQWRDRRSCPHLSRAASVLARAATAVRVASAGTLRCHSDRVAATPSVRCLIRCRLRGARRGRPAPRRQAPPAAGSRLQAESGDAAVPRVAVQCGAPRTVGRVGCPGVPVAGQRDHRPTALVLRRRVAQPGKVLGHRLLQGLFDDRAVRCPRHQRTENLEFGCVRQSRIASTVRARLTSAQDPGAGGRRGPRNCPRAQRYGIARCRRPEASLPRFPSMPAHHSHRRPGRQRRDSRCRAAVSAPTEPG